MLQPLDKQRLQQYLTIAGFAGLAFALTEYLIRLNRPDEQVFLPLLARSLLNAGLIAVSITLFEARFRRLWAKKPFYHVVLARSAAYTLIVVFWLILINGLWQMIASNTNLWGGINNYVTDSSFPINFITVFLVILVLLTAIQINGLHRKGELINFILGRFHRPQEVNRIFLFVDLKNSTTIAENLGHYRFGLLLKEFYGDITPAVWSTKAEIYQYVGDEVILAWPSKTGFKNSRVIQCVRLIHREMINRRDYYLEKYGVLPHFRAGAHCGEVLITWVGEIKKEILYVGDVLNTTARILEDCKRLNCDFLISGDIVQGLDPVIMPEVDFQEETVPRGKEKAVTLYSVVMDPRAED